MGLPLNKLHLSSSLLLVGSGIAIGVAASMVLASTTGYDLVEWFRIRDGELVDDLKGAKAREHKGPGFHDAGSENHSQAT